VYDPQAKLLSLQWVVAVAIGFVLLRIWVMRGWFMDETGAAYVFFDIGLYGVIWILAFAGLCWVARGGWTGDIDICQVGCLAGVVAFVLHSLIDMAMFFPGTLMPFAAMAGILVTDKPRRSESPAIASRPGIPMAIFAVGAALFGVLVLIPVARANALLQEARFASSGAQRWPLFERAIDADPLDPTAPVELALTYVGSGGDVETALAWYNEGIRRDPKQVGLHRGRAGLHEMSFRRTGAMADLMRAIGSARVAVSMYPSSPDDHLFLADMLARNAAAAGPECIDEAILHYQRALELDAARHPGELRRWSKSHRQTIQDRLDQLLEMAASQPA
jgi:hypothetical protein